MTPWEYATATVDQGLVPLEDLNTMGRDGWELVTIVSRPGLPERAVFKRPVQAASAPAKKAAKR